jgi:hypothetical protein
MKKAKPRKADSKFPALEADFDWSNEEWARTFLPQIRIANLVIQRNDKALEKIMAVYVENGMVTEILEAWLDTVEHLEGVKQLLTCALARSSIVLKRMGYESAKPIGAGRKESRA